MSSTISFPIPEDGSMVSIAGSFNDWRPEPMQLSRDRSSYEKVLHSRGPGTQKYTYKFLLSNGEWVLNTESPSKPDENGILNHEIQLSAPILASVLDDVVDQPDPDMPNHIARPENISVPQGLGHEVIDSETRNNEYSFGHKSDTSSGPGLVDAEQPSVSIGDRMPSASSHDTHLNPAAPAFKPIAQPFIPASNPPRHSHSNSRSSHHRQRSQSRTRRSHSRSSSVASQGQRSGSNVHHDELNPTAHEFKPQFAQPTNHVTHASGYAAALKKPASPPVKEEFKKPQLPVTKQAPIRTSVSDPQSGETTLKVNSANSYAEMAKHAKQPSDEPHVSQARSGQHVISEQSQRAAVALHKDPALTDEALRAGSTSSGGVIGDLVVRNSRESREIDSSLEDAVHQSAGTSSLPKKDPTSMANSEREELTESTVDPAIESVKRRVSEIKDSIVESVRVPNAAEETEVVQGLSKESNKDLDRPSSEVAKDRRVDEQSSVNGATNDLPGTISKQSAAIQDTTQSVNEKLSESVQPVADGLASLAEDVRLGATQIASGLQNSVQATSAFSSTIAAEDDDHGNESDSRSSDQGLSTIELSDKDYDAEQVRLMEEVCILLDRDDNPVGSASKKDAHLMTNINDGLLHRAFSLFIFDSKDRLLLQQRASEKITFPDMWTNTCCSHPLSIHGEVAHDLSGSIAGVKQAAQRKVDQELGIKPNDAPISEMNFLTRIHYLAPSDGKWGEHEVDYILFLRANPTLTVNPNEVKDHKWVSQDDLRQMFNSHDLSYTPWFKLICETFLYKWWDNLESLDQVKDEETIHRLGIESALYDKISHSTDSPALGQGKASPVDSVATEVATALQSGASAAANAVTDTMSALSDQASVIQSTVVKNLQSAVSLQQSPDHSDKTVADPETVEPAAEDQLPIGESTASPEFENSATQDLQETPNHLSQTKITDTSEPAADQDSLPLVESRDPVESEVQASFNATATEADVTQTPQAPDAILELSPTGQARVDAHAETETPAEVSSRPSTGKSIRPRENLFFYIFNSLFGGLFRGFSTIWDKLAFWRKSPHPTRR